jgi:hypothetical protein
MYQGDYEIEPPEHSGGSLPIPESIQVFFISPELKRESPHSKLWKGAMNEMPDS